MEIKEEKVEIKEEEDVVEKLEPFINTDTENFKDIDSTSKSKKHSSCRVKSEDVDDELDAHRNRKHKQDRNKSHTKDRNRSRDEDRHKSNAKDRHTSRKEDRHRSDDEDKHRSDNEDRDNRRSRYQNNRSRSTNVSTNPFTSVQIATR